MARASRHNTIWLFFGCFAFITLLRMLYTTRIPLTGDEAYFWVWSQHPALGYYDHPPMIAWLIGLCTGIGGDTLFWTRFPAVLCLAGTTYLSYLLGRRIGGAAIGIAAGLFTLAGTAMTLMSVVVATDAPLILFWIWTVYLVWRAVQTHDGRYWYGAGLTLGLGLLSKFIILPLIAGVFLFLVFSPEDRFWLKRKEPFLASALALLVFAPFVVWNSRHGWLTFVFNATRYQWSFSFTRPVVFYLGLQAICLSPLLYAGLLWSGWRLIRRVSAPRTEDGRIALFILLHGWLLLGLFFLQSFWQPTSAHWTMSAYGTVFIGLALELSRRAEECRRMRTVLGPWLLATASIWTVLVASLTIRPDLLPIASISGHTVNEVYGWEELGRKVSILRRRIGSENPVATSSYVDSSMISFYAPDHLYVAVLGPGSINGRSFDLWDRWDDKWVGRNVLYLSNKPITGSAMLRETCAYYEVLPPIDLHHRGRVVRRFYPALGHRLKKDPYAARRRSFQWRPEPRKTRMPMKGRDR